MIVKILISDFEAKTVVLIGKFGFLRTSFFAQEPFILLMLRNFVRISSI